MAERQVFLTPKGKRKLEEELEYLCTVRRPQVAERIRESQDAGDLMENAEYEDAKNEQAFIEGRILTIETLLKSAVLIEESIAPGNEVGIGSRVTIREEGAEDPETYRIVGSTEADPRQGQISNESPLGRALMGRSPGERVMVQTPDGVLRFQILSIK